MNLFKEFASVFSAQSWRAKMLRYSVYTVLSLLAIFLVLTQIVVRLWLWPQIETKKTDFENRISQTLGVEAHIEEIHASWKVFRPAFKAKNITFIGKHPDLKSGTKPVLQIPEIQGVLRWDSFLGLAPRFQELKNSQANIEIFRGANGRWFVAGIEIPEADGDSGALDWLMTENDFILENLEINILDELEKTNSLQTHVKKFELNNSGRQHYIKVVANSELAKGDLFFEGDFKHRLFAKRNNWMNWYGDFSWNVEGINLINVLRMTKLPIRVTNGIAHAKGSFELNQGKMVGGQGQVIAEDVDINWLGTKNSIQLKRLNADFENTAEGDLQFITAKKLSWKFKNDPLDAPDHSLSNSSFGWKATNFNKPLETIAIRSPLIDLKEMSRLASGLPLPVNRLKQLEELNLTGQLQNLEVIWHQGVKDNLAINLLNTSEPALSLRAQLNQVGWDSSSLKIPAVKGLSGSVSNEKLAGELALNSNKLQVETEHLIHRKNIEIDEARGSIFWGKIADQWTFGTKNLKLKNSSVELLGNVSYRMPAAKKSADLDLDIQVQQAKLSELPSYLPTSIPKDLFTYLNETLIDGLAKNGRVTIKGAPEYIPYSQKHPGTFKFETTLENATYRPAPKNPREIGQWPALSGVYGRVSMDGNLLFIDLPKASYKSVLIQNSKAQADFSKTTPQIEITSKAEGGTNEFLEYLAASPILAKNSATLKDFNIQGKSRLDLKLLQNLDAKASSKFTAKIDFENHIVEWDKKSLGKISEGTLTIKETGYTDTNITAELLEEPLQIKNLPNPGWGLLIKGSVDAAKLVQLTPGPSSPSEQEIKKQIKGKVNYQGSIGEKIGNGLVLDLDLKPTAIDLPPPLSKPIGVTMPGQFTLNSKEQGLEWNFQLAQRFQSKGTLGRNGKLLKHGISLGNLSANPPNSGTNITFDVDFLDGDAWNTLLSKGDLAKAPRAGVEQVPSDIQTISGKFKRVKFADRMLTDFSLNATHEKFLWKANVTSQHINGTIEWQAPNVGLPSGQINAKLSKLHIPDEESSQTLTTGLQKSTGQIPKLDITANTFILGSKNLGALEIKATNVEKIWKLETLKIKHPSAKFNATATWVLPSKNSQGQTDMQFEIVTDNGGNLMNSLGYPKVLDEGEGQMSGTISWQGAPYTFNKETLSGDLKFEMRKGKLLQVDPGAAKLLGILSFQSLFKLATLNLEGGYGDAILPGTYFDKLSGSANLRQGVAKTEDFELNSNLARMAAKGEVNLIRETQDLRSTVYPKVNLGGTSLAAFYFVNPIVGLSTWVGQFLLTSGVNKALQADYLIQGSWKDPEIIPLDQKGQPADPEVLKKIRSKNLLTQPVGPTPSGTVPATPKPNGSRPGTQ